MIVYIGYNCLYNGRDVFRNVEKVFRDESAAIKWEKDVPATEHEWREYDEYSVE